jgi:hypothetical protein
VTEKPAGRRPLDGAQEYLYLGYALLAVMLLALVTRRIGPAAVLPALLAGVGLQIRFRPAPLLVLVMVGVMLYWNDLGRAGTRAFTLSDIALSASLLGYILVHYRLLGLLEGLSPMDPRQRQKANDPQNESRSSDLGWLILSLPIWAMAAYVAWRLLVLLKPPVDMTAPTWQGSVATIALLGGLLIVRGLIGYVRWRELARGEALLYLEDTIWQETRREQRLAASFVSAKISRKANS